jgi:Tfp pilus assembly protein PilO
MTETRKWALGTAVLVAALLIGSWFLLVSPKKAAAADLTTQTDAQIAANAQLETEISVLKAQSKNLPEMQAKLARLDTKIPSDPQLPTLIRQLSEAADRAGVDLVSLTPSAPAVVGVTPGTTVTDTAGTLNAITLGIVATGGYFELQQFFNEVENMPRALLVNKSDLTDTPTDGTAPTTTEGSADASVLSATITAQVFLVPPAEVVVPTDPTAATTPTPTPAQ